MIHSFIAFISIIVVEATLLAAVNPPILLQRHATFPAETKSNVVIYYANESSPTADELRNYEVLSAWLLASNTKIGSQQAHRWQVDLKKFPETVDADLTALQKLVSTASGNNLGIVIATNRTFRTGYLEVYDPKIAAWSRVSVPVGAYDNYIRASNILANEESLRTVLAKTAELFPPKNHSFLLHVKSHGMATHVISTNISKRHEDITKTDLIAALRTAETADRTNDATEHLDANKIGITKEQFVSILNTYSARHGMLFPIVFLESCRSGVNIETIGPGLTDVGYLITSDQAGIEYSNIDFAAITLQDDGAVFRAYFQQLTNKALATHQSQYQLQLDLPRTFPPTKTLRDAAIERSLKIWQLLRLN